MSEKITYVKRNVQRIRSGHLPLRRRGMVAGPVGARGASRGSHGRRRGSVWAGEQEAGACQVVSPWQWEFSKDRSGGSHHFRCRSPHWSWPSGLGSPRMVLLAVWVRQIDPHYPVIVTGASRGSVHQCVSVCIGGSSTLRGIADCAPSKALEPAMHTDAPSRVKVSGQGTISFCCIANSRRYCPIMTGNACRTIDGPDGCSPGRDAKRAVPEQGGRGGEGYAVAGRRDRPRQPLAPLPYPAPAACPVRAVSRPGAAHFQFTASVSAPLPE